MKIILMGYMASGKSLIGRKLSDILNMKFIDFDEYIVLKESMSITDIFKSKGEIYFRKIESKYLQDVLYENNSAIISLGGGTPCYANNLEVIKRQSETISIYLQVSVHELSKRLLKDKLHRPLLNQLKTETQLNEYIGKHLFERMSFYNQAAIHINANQTPKDIIEEIIIKLF